MTGERVLSTLNMILLQLAGLGIVFFWTIGAIFLLTGNGGQINDIALTPFWRTVYFSFPFLVIFISPIAWLAFFRKADLIAQGMMTLPIAVIGLMYLVYIMSNTPIM